MDYDREMFSTLRHKAVEFLMIFIMAKRCENFTTPNELLQRLLSGVRLLSGCDAPRWRCASSARAKAGYAQLAAQLARRVAHECLF